jgi:hypothetical protein
LLLKNGHSRETGNIDKYTRREKTKLKHNPTRAGQHYAQTNTNNVNTTTGGKDERNIVVECPFLIAPSVFSNVYS